MQRQTLNFRRRIGFLCMLASIIVTAPALAQQNRMRAYEKSVKERISKTVEEFRLARLEAKKLELQENATTNATPRTLGNPAAVRPEIENDPAVKELKRPFKSVVNLQESNDGDGQDVEMRLTMPIDAFMDYAPIAGLEAAAVPHKFPVVYIYLREETTDRVARVAFKDAEPLASRYLAGDKDAVEEMRDALIWH